MKIHPPNDPDYTTPGGAWLKRLKDYAKSLRLVSVPGFRISHTANGTYLEPIGGGGGGAPAKSVQPYTIAEVRGSIIKASDGTYIAKPPELRYVLSGETIDGTSWSYAYDTTYPVTDTRHQARIATAIGGSYSEQQVITPRYIIGGIVWAYQPSNTLITSTDLTDSPGVTSSMVTLMDADAGSRAWAQKFGS